jgi:hypothetical protein
MATVAAVYGKHIEGQYGTTAARRIDWASDTIRVSLHTNTYAEDVDAHDFRDDLTNEVTGTGYSAGGNNLASKAIVFTGASNKVAFDAADLSWTSATISNIRKAVAHKNVGTAATDPLIAIHTFDADISVTAGTFTIAWDADGVFRATY